MSKQLQLQFFPEPVIRLNRELTFHPQLNTWLAERYTKPGLDQLPEKLAEVAAYCDVLLDGTYSQEDLEGLADILVDKLQAKRSMVLRVH